MLTKGLPEKLKKIHVLRGELDTKVSIPVFEGEKQRLLAGMEELAGKVHQTTVRDDNFQKDLDGYRIKLDNTITRLMEERSVSVFLSFSHSRTYHRL